MSFVPAAAGSSPREVERERKADEGDVAHVGGEAAQNRQVRLIWRRHIQAASKCLKGRASSGSL